jgi:hypothetical protein
MSRTELSQLFTVYNAALIFAAERKLDKERLDKALGLAMSKRFRDNPHYHGYTYTDKECNCPDAVERFITCKHQIAVALLKVALG